jgi:DNA modification methylase
MILQGHVLDVIRQIPDESVHCVVTSPPYWGLRNYGTEPQVWPGEQPPCEVHDWGAALPRRSRKSTDVVDGESKQATNVGAIHDLPTSEFCRRCNAWRGELGLEPTPELYVKHIVEIFREVRRVLRKDGTLWLNLGDSYAGSNCGSNDYRPEGASLSKSGSKYRGQKPGLPTGLKPKDLVGIPWMVAFALRADGWWLRCDIIWHKPNPMPESVTDRPTKSHEYIFLLTKSDKYFYDAEAIYEPAAYDGRRDTFFKGGVKYKGFQEHTMLSRGHERWPNRIKIDQSDKNARNGRGIVGHSGYFKANGEPNFAIKDGCLRAIAAVYGLSQQSHSKALTSQHSRLQSRRFASKPVHRRRAAARNAARRGIEQ